VLSNAVTFGHTPEGTPHGLVCIETKPEQCDWLRLKALEASD
jgi:hypothetical protein